MRKTFEELLGKGNKLHGEIVYPKHYVISLMEKIRIKTLEEAEKFIKIEDFGYSTNKKELLNLDKNSIEL